MTETLRFDYTKALPFLAQAELENQQGAIRTAHEMLHSRTGPGSDYLGWIDLPTAYDRAEFARIKAAAARIQSDTDALVVVGIGGS